jgi:hypothetical protein
MLKWDNDAETYCAEAQTLEQEGEGVKTECQARERGSAATRMSDNSFVNKKWQLDN